MSVEDLMEQFGSNVEQEDADSNFGGSITEPGLKRTKNVQTSK